MRRAIQDIVDKGLLVRRRGIGTQVVQGSVRRELELSSLYDDLLASGQEPETSVLHNGTEDASAEIATKLGLSPGEPVLRLERVRLAAGKPLAVLRNWLPADLLHPTDADLVEHGLYELLRHEGVHLRIARQRIGARGATTEEGRLLGGRKSDPLLTMQRVAYTDAGRAAEHGDHCYLPDSYSFEVTLVQR